MVLFRIVLFLSVFMPTLSYGQQKQTVEERFKGIKIGHRDAIDVFKDFSDAYRNKNWKEAYAPWRMLMTNVPFADYTITHYSRANNFLQELIKEESDSVMKYVYYLDIEEMLNYAERHIEVINSFDEAGEKYSVVTPAVIQCWQAFLYWNLQNELGKVYSTQEAYNKFTRAFETLRNTENIESSGELNFSWLIEKYFTTCTELYNLDKEDNLERFLTDYITCLETCDKMMDTYSKDSVQWRNFAAVHNNIQVYFNETDAGNKQNLVNYYTPLLESNKNNISFLKNAIHLMMYNGCLNEEVFFQACEYAHSQEHSFENCIGLGKRAMTEEHYDREKAKEYFTEAIDLASTAGERWLAARFTSDALYDVPPLNLSSPGENASREEILAFNDSVRNWRINFEVPIPYYKDALRYAEEAGVGGQYLWQIYYNLSDCYNKTDKFDEAREALKMARQSYSAETHEVLYNRREEAIASAENTFKKNQKIYDNPANKAARAAYNAYIAKKKAEENFWKMGRK